MEGALHVPVMLDEVVSFLQPERGGVAVDCTVGLGGHAQALLARGASRLLGLDRDTAALERAEDMLAPWKERVELVHADYRELATVLDARGIKEVGALFADLGVSSMQLDCEGRGFSFRRDEPLDMRMDQTRGETAAEWLAGVEQTDLANVIFQFGEERHSRRIARALVAARERAPLATTGQVADIVRRALPRKGWQPVDPATRTFQAFRIWVNRELEGLDEFLTIAAARLGPEARLAVITFHSLEDRIVKHTFRAIERDEPVARTFPGLRERTRVEGGSAIASAATYRVLTKRPVAPGDDELARNPRARSAKLRVLERTTASR